MVNVLAGMIASFRMVMLLVAAAMAVAAGVVAVVVAVAVAEVAMEAEAADMAVVNVLRSRRETVNEVIAADLLMPKKFLAD